MKRKQIVKIRGLQRQINESLYFFQNVKNVVCDSKKSRFIKDGEASGLLNSLGIRTPFSQITLVGPFLL